MDIQVHNLTKIFGALRANDGISLGFAAGQIHGVLGENGAGKSTLMKLLSGFLRRDAGEILLDSRPVRLDGPGDALRAGIGMVHQDPLDVPAFRAIENFYCGAPRTVFPSRPAARRRLRELAEWLGFSVDPDDLVGALTVGQRQQLEIMRLLAWGARVFILDEPTTGITAMQRLALFAALRRLASEGSTVLFVSHKLEEVDVLCDTVSVLRAGKLVGEQMRVPQRQDRLLALMFGEQMAADGGQAQEDQRVSPALQHSPPNTHPPVWRLEDVSIRQGQLELRGLTIEIPAGSVLGLAGLDGSGQQLFLRLLAGLLRPSAGRVWLNGQDVTGAPAALFRRAGVQHLPADRLADGLVGAMSLSEHIALQEAAHSWLLNMPGAERAAQAAIATYDIKATPGLPMASLSGGNQQRAMLALLPDHCAGVLLDQPTRGLDVASARGVWQRLLARRSDGTAIVFASSDFDELLDHSDRVLVFFSCRVSHPLPRAELNQARLAELIGGVGFEAIDGG